MNLSDSSFLFFMLGNLLFKCIIASSVASNVCFVLQIRNYPKSQPWFRWFFLTLHIPVKPEVNLGIYISSPNWASFTSFWWTKSINFLSASNLTEWIWMFIVVPPLFWLIFKLLDEPVCIYSLVSQKYYVCKSVLLRDLHAPKIPLLN
jgi:hypothetical protein